MKYDLVKLAYDLGYKVAMQTKSAGPTLQEKAWARVPGAAEKLRQRQAEQAYRAAHPNPLGSLSEQKRWLAMEGKKRLARMSPEQQQQFWADARNFQANVMRGRALAGSFMPGIGVAGASAVAGLGETGASVVEGRPVSEAIRRGATTGLGAYVGGRAINDVALPAAHRIASHFGADKLVNPIKQTYDAYSNGRSVIDLGRSFAPVSTVAGRR